MKASFSSCVEYIFLLFSSVQQLQDYFMLFINVKAFKVFYNKLNERNKHFCSGERNEKDENCNDDNPLIMLFRTEMMQKKQSLLRFKGD